MPHNISVLKASGELEKFSEEKLYQSLHNAGAGDTMISWVIDQIRPQLVSGISTRKIYKMAFKLLRQKIGVLASRYSLKEAIMELGPTGFPFEKFVAEIFNAQGFNTLTGQIIQGRCVTHEVDVVAWKNNLQLLVECKYHNTAGRICHVQVPLYIHSRFNDVRYMWQQEEQNKNKNYEGWIVTNTRYSSDAEDYGKCAGLQLIGWDYPRNGNLKNRIEMARLFPVTAISQLNHKQKQSLLDAGILLCRQLLQQPEQLKIAGIKPQMHEKILDEVQQLIALD
ncbi:MAG: restriction endonuclease [Lentimicrobiaceae bacterium]|nr:restriction endonuclease [Lentimicrobiaceae bacterium]